MSYFDAYLAAVPDENRDAYVANADKIGAVFRRHGALRYVESWGDDVPDGDLTSFAKAVLAEPGETVVLGWAEWPSKEHREQVRAQLMDDLHAMMAELPLPFDGKRMIFGGFESVIEV